MPCACSAPRPSTLPKNIVPIIQRHPKNDEVQKLKEYIKNHPRINEQLFKNSMIIILQEIIKSFHNN